MQTSNKRETTRRPNPGSSPGAGKAALREGP